VVSLLLYVIMPTLMMHDASEESPVKKRFVHEVPLIVDFAAASELHHRFDTARRLYNALLGEALRRIRRMRHRMRTHHHLRLQCKAQADAAIAENDLHPKSKEARKIRKIAFAPYNELRTIALRETECSRYGLSAYGTKLSRNTPRWASGHAIGATVVQELVRRAWLAAEKHLLDPRIRCTFVRYGELHSVESMNDADAIRVVDDCVLWSGGLHEKKIAMRLRFDRKGRDWVEHYARQCAIVKTRILRRQIKRRTRYVAQIVLAGTPVERPWITTIPGEDVGIDLGLSVVAVDSDKESAIYSLTTVSPEQRAALAAKQRRINRALDRSRRASNPEKYDEKGRILHRRAHKRVKGEKAPRTHWTFSETYRDHKEEYAEASRVIAARRKNATRTLVNHIVSLGNVGVIEDLSMRKWQQEYGKSTGFAPGEFTTALANRMHALGGDLHKIPAYIAKLSQFCIHCGTYQKRDFTIRVLERRQRCSACGSDQDGIQADLFQAFLARHVRIEGTIDDRQAKAAWPGARMRLGAASSRVHNAAKTVFARSRRWRNQLAAEQRAVQSGSVAVLEPGSSRRGKRADLVSVKAIDHRAPKWGECRAGPLDPEAVRQRRRSRSSASAL
jgi:putative transposase